MKHFKLIKNVFAFEGGRSFRKKTQSFTFFDFLLVSLQYLKSAILTTGASLYFARIIGESCGNHLASYFRFNLPKITFYAPPCSRGQRRPQRGGRLCVALRTCVRYARFWLSLQGHFFSVLASQLASNRAKVQGQPQRCWALQRAKAKRDKTGNRLASQGPRLLILYSK